MRTRYESLGLLNGFSGVDGATYRVNLDFLNVLHGFQEGDPKKLAVGLLDLQDTLDSLQHHLDTLRQAAEASVAA